MQKTEYQIISQNESKKLTQFLCKEGQLLLPMVELYNTPQKLGARLRWICRLRR